MGSNAEYNEVLSPMSWIFGVWESVEAVMTYPTVETVKYNEIVEFHPTTLSFVDYKSQTWHAEKKSKLHCECGFFRIDPVTQKVAFLVAHHYGITEVSEGSIEKETLSLESQTISQASFITTVATEKIVRKWSLEEENLHCTVFLQTATQPLQLHLKCIYKRKE